MVQLVCVMHRLTAKARRKGNDLPVCNEAALVCFSLERSCFYKFSFVCLPGLLRLTTKKYIGKETVTYGTHHHTIPIYAEAMGVSKTGAIALVPI